MKGQNRMAFVAAMAACMAGVGNGVDVLRDMFTPRFHAGGDGNPRSKHRNKHRNSGAGLRGRKHHNAEQGCGAKQCQKQLRKTPNGDSREYDKRMAWMAQPRIQAVIAKREADQLRARSV